MIYSNFSLIQIKRKGKIENSPIFRFIPYLFLELEIPVPERELVLLSRRFFLPWRKERTRDYPLWAISREERAKRVSACAGHWSQSNEIENS
jgi:hypothetical protein